MIKEFDICVDNYILTMCVILRLLTDFELKYVVPYYYFNLVGRIIMPDCLPQKLIVSTFLNFFEYLGCFLKKHINDFSLWDNKEYNIGRFVDIF